MRRIVATIALLVCSVGCGSRSVKRDGAAFELATLFAGYTHTAWLNNEPISWGYAQSTPVLYGFPLQTGSNHFTVKIEILPPPEEPPRIIRLEALVRDTEKDPTEKVDWTEVDDFDRSRPFTETSYVWESEFELKSQVGQTFDDFDAIGSNKQSVAGRARLLAIAFATKLRDGNKTEWGRIWGPGGELQFGLSMAPFAGTNQFSAKSVSESSELVVETGSYLVLVHLKSGALVEFLDNSNVRRSGYADFLFAQSGGKWRIRGANRHWWTLPDDLQHF